MSMVREDRLIAIIAARAGVAKASAAEIGRALFRFAPRDIGEADWRTMIGRALDSAKASGVLDEEGRATDESLRAHFGRTAVGATWRQLVDQVLPLRGLAVPPNDTKAASRLRDRDAWTAAIAGRLLGLWSHGAPPSLSTVCDAFAWRELGLAGRAKRCPPEVRGVFLRRALGVDAEQPDRVLRLYIARELDVPRPELRALRDGVVRRWLVGEELRAQDAPHATDRPVVAAAVDAARLATRGVFAGRKVFVSAVWDDLRRDPAWSSLELDELKRQLVAAHRAGELVLARADLVAAMDPALVAASEITADGASFHFIVRGDVP